jgi:FMN-dependent NADH-azoreductase
LVHRVLADQALDLVDHDFAKAMLVHQTADAAADVPALDLSEVLIGELEASDVLVLSTPMHNFTVPAALKAWIDQVVRFGRSFRSTPDGKIGLLADRPTYLVISSGGYFTGERARQPDHLTPYLKDILPTIGLESLEFILLEGLSRGDEAVDEAYATARGRIQALLAA